MSARPAYFDTSTLLKRYVEEQGSLRVRALLRRFRCVVSAVTPVEALSALYRRWTAGELAERDLSRLLASLDRDRAHWDLLDVDSHVLARAGEVIASTGVRTLDAIHLASAELAQTYGGRRLPLVTADAAQRVAGERLGLDILWID